MDSLPGLRGGQKGNLRQTDVTDVLISMGLGEGKGRGKNCL